MPHLTMWCMVVHVADHWRERGQKSIVMSISVYQSVHSHISESTQPNITFVHVACDHSSILI